MLIESKFMTSKIPYLISTHSEESIMRNVLNIYEECIIRVPNKVYSLNFEFIQNYLIDSLKLKYDMIYKLKLNTIKSNFKVLNKGNVNSDNDIEFSSIIPTVEELKMNYKNKNLVKNKIAEEYDSVDSYLKTHFNLLKEDYTDSLRIGLHGSKKDKKGLKKYKVKLDCILIQKGSFEYCNMVKLDMNRKSLESLVNSSNKLKRGSLVFIYKESIQIENPFIGIIIY